MISISKLEVTNRTSSEPSLTSLRDRGSKRVLRNVRWNPGVRVVLIPTCSEYRDSNICNRIWWTDIEINSFKDAAVLELKNAMRKLSIDSKNAIKLLYQPSSFDKESETANNINVDS